MTVAAGGGAAAAAAAAAQAIKASGVIVSVTPDDFQSLANRNDGGLVVHAHGGVFAKRHKYLMAYKGLAFFTKSERQLFFSSRMEVMEAKKMWMPE